VIERLGKLLATRWGAVVLHPVLLLLAFPPFDLGWVVFPAWAVLLASARLRGGKAAGRMFFAASLVFYLAGLYWTAHIWYPGWIVAALYCALWEGLFGWALGRFLARAPADRRWLWIVLAPAAHLLFDLLRTVVLTGFPWFLAGYAGWRNPILLGSADLLGVHTATLAILLVAAGLAEALARRSEGKGAALRALAPAGVVWALLALWTVAKPGIPERPGPRVAVLQANIPQWVKEDREQDGAERMTVEDWLKLHYDLIREGRAEAARDGRPIDVVIWPETMFPRLPVEKTFQPVLLPIDDPRNALLAFRLMRSSSGSASTLAGVSTFAPADDKWRNSVVLLDPAGTPLGVQHKQHLTPGGETLIFLELLPDSVRDWLQAWLEDWAGYLPDLVAGEKGEVLPVSWGAETAGVGVIICYECVFPSLTREMAEGGADFLVNASNYGWFTGTAQMEQALAQLCFRAAETHRAVVAAGNNGVSALIGPAGSLRKVLTVGGERSDVRGVLVVDVPLATGSGLFTIVGEWGAAVLGLAGLIAGLALATRRRSS